MVALAVLVLGALVVAPLIMTTATVIKDETMRFILMVGLFVLGILVGQIMTVVWPV